MKLARSLDLTALLLGSFVAAVLAAGCDSGGVNPTPTPTSTVLSSSEATSSSTAVVRPRVAATNTAPPTATPGPPYLERFAAGEVIDVAPAVVFVDPRTGEAEAWVIPGAVWPEFAVAPDGSYVIYVAADDEFRLLRTDDGNERAIPADSLPLELGPGGAGFVATTQDRFVVSAFDGRGEHLGELWLGGVSVDAAVSWSEDGSAIAYAFAPGGGDVLQLTIWSLSGGERLEVDAGGSARGVSLEWSHDSQRIAVATDRDLLVLSRAGELLGRYEGEIGGQFGGFWANPRWSPDNRFLFTDDMPRQGGELAYVFTAGATPVFRFFTPSYAGGCGGDQWVDDSTLEFGEHDVRVDGTFELHGRVDRDVWSVERLGVILAEGVSFHLAHAGARNGSGELADGRLVFTTPGAGHGGCGEGWSGSTETEPVIEWPPYQDRQ